MVIFNSKLLNYHSLSMLIQHVPLCLAGSHEISTSCSFRTASKISDFKAFSKSWETDPGSDPVGARLGPGCSKRGIVGHRFQMIFEVQNLQTLSACVSEVLCLVFFWGGPVFNALNVAFSLSEMQMKKPWQNHKRNLRRGTPTYGFPSAGSNKNRSKRSDNSAQKSES